MFIKKNFSLKGVLAFTGGHIVWITAWSFLVAMLWKFFDLEWLVIPWIPISVVATAVAFYIGFKNNSAYDRLWEARKIWGAIVNSSRMWGATVRSFVSNQFTEGEFSDPSLKAAHSKLLHRHIAYLYILRSQLLVPTNWEHISQRSFVRKVTLKRLKTFGVKMFNDFDLEETLEKYLGKDEMETIIAYQNSATQLIDLQSQNLKDLRKLKMIDDFRHMELQKILNDFYTHQGKAERIKKFPLPRQYGSSSFIFVAIFIFILPFGLIGEFSKLGDVGIWLFIPFNILVAWVYLFMELIGDYSENPFEGLGNDIPMLSLCRIIEIDLLQMMGETDLPAKIEPKSGVLM